MAKERAPYNPALSGLIEKQMRNWELARAQRPESPLAPGEEVAQFVTLGNIVGAGGHDVAAGLQKKLKWPVFDRQILTTMAGDDEVRTRLYQSMDERDLGWFENTFRSLLHHEFGRNDYFSRLTETVLFLARKGPAIFIGRSTDLILPKDKGFRVKVIASLERCAQNFAKHNDMSLIQARREVERIERERRDFVQNHFPIDAYEPTRFDMLIHVERFTTAQAVELILMAMRMRGITK